MEESKIDAKEFADSLEMNEKSMGELAAFDITCREYGISQGEGYGLLRSLSEPVSRNKT